jgi:hypothetical protein
MLTGCWQQGAAISQDNTSIEGDLSMMILCELGNYQPLWRIQTWALERLITLHVGSGDLRWALISLALSTFAAAWALGRRRIARLAGRGAGQAADTPLAAACH